MTPVEHHYEEVVVGRREIELAIVPLYVWMQPKRPCILIEQLYELQDVHPEASHRRVLEGDQAVRGQVEEAHEEDSGVAFEQEN